jgi:hypothetical protein
MFFSQLFGGSTPHETSHHAEEEASISNVAEQTQPVSEQYKSSSVITSKPNKSHIKKTKKHLSIIRPRTIHVEKIPKSIKRRLSSLEHKASKYEKQEVDVEHNEERIEYVPFVFTRYHEGGIGQAIPREVIRNTATRILLNMDEYEGQLNNGSTGYYDFDVISQLKHLKRIDIYGANISRSAYIIKGVIHKGNKITLTELKPLLEASYPGFKNIEFVMHVYQ